MDSAATHQAKSALKHVVDHVQQWRGILGIQTLDHPGTRQPHLSDGISWLRRCAGKSRQQGVQRLSFKEARRMGIAIDKRSLEPHTYIVNY